MLTVFLALLLSSTPSSSHLTPPGTLHEINVHRGERSLFWKDLRHNSKLIKREYSEFIITPPPPHPIYSLTTLNMQPLFSLLSLSCVNEVSAFYQKSFGWWPVAPVKRREAHLCHGWHFNLLLLAVLFPSIVHQCIRTNVMGHRRISAFNSIDRHLWLRLYRCRCREKATMTWKYFAFTHLISVNIQKKGERKSARIK